ncbi:MAG: glycosyltransferase family 4 protein [Candidatus Hydrogenedentes bacterium]|nr:glycosyltransferase family 4 protein [Candidatus Hydrogenedentota bacterium]
MTTPPRVNVLFLIRTWAFGGSHTIVLHLLKHLPRDQFNIVCVPFRTRGKGDEEFIREARKRDLPLADERIPWMSRRDWWRARRAVSDLIERYAINLIHTHDPHSNVLIGLGRDRWPCACVASAYGWWDALFPLRRTLYTWIESHRALRRFDRVITVSNHMKGKILRGTTPEERIRVIHTGLDTSALNTGESRAAARARFGLPEDAQVVGTVSRLSIEKGHIHLLDAAAALRDKFPALRLLIVGDGPAKAGLEAHAAQCGLKERVTFTGFCDNLPAALASMDVFAQPSVQEEGFPTAILEAQLAGLPVVASDIGGTCETMHLPDTGLLAPPGDARALAGALGTLLSAPDRRESMGAAARAWVEQSFTLDTMIRQVADTYREAIEAYRGPGKRP